MEQNELLLKRPNYVERVCGTVLNALFALIVLVLIVSFITTVNYSLNVIDGDSMNPTLTDGQYVLCEKKPKIEKIGRGDIIVFNYDEKTQYIKRAVAVGGDTVKFVTDANGYTVTLFVQYGSEGEFVPLEEDYIAEKMTVAYWENNAVFFGLGVPFRVSENCVFALGDNRNESKDSRVVGVGQVKADAIVGRVRRAVRKGSIEEAYFGFIYGTFFKTTAESL